MTVPAGGDDRFPRGAPMTLPAGGGSPGRRGAAMTRPAEGPELGGARPGGSTVHLVGGFLGSGKTTAIANACKLLAARGLTAGVVTNDQGRYLVDTAFFRAASVPATEVVDGCFCCNLEEYRAAVDRLLRTEHPLVVFAEAVGSCADLVATVIKPSDVAGGRGEKVASYSVFVDARLARLWLSGASLPFGEEITYLFEKQMDEAGLLVLNKVDLVPDALREEIAAGIAARFPGKAVRSQCSLREADIDGWLADLSASEAPATRPSLAIDYRRYAAAEAGLAWYDARLHFTRSPGRAAGDASARDGQAAGDSARALAAGSLVTALLGHLRESIAAEGRRIGHLKLQVRHADGECKLSLTEADAALPPTELRVGEGPLRLLLNARVSGDPEGLERIVRGAVKRVAARSGWRVRITGERAFSPSYPHPTERIG